MNNSTSIIPNTTPPPTTIATPTTPAQAAKLWKEATEAGRVVVFFSNGKHQGGTTAKNDLDSWLND